MRCPESPQFLPTAGAHSGRPVAAQGPGHRGGPHLRTQPPVSGHPASQGTRVSPRGLGCPTVASGPDCPPGGAVVDLHTLPSARPGLSAGPGDGRSQVPHCREQLALPGFLHRCPSSPWPQPTRPHAGALSLSLSQVLAQTPSPLSSAPLLVGTVWLWCLSASDSWAPASSCLSLQGATGCHPQPPMTPQTLKFPPMTSASHTTLWF